MVVQLNQTTDRNVSLLEDRIRQLTELLAKADKKIGLLRREGEKHEVSQSVYNHLVKSRPARPGGGGRGGRPRAQGPPRGDPAAAPRGVHPAGHRPPDQHEPGRGRAGDLPGGRGTVGTAMVKKYVCFAAGQGRYGIPLDQVVRIIRREEITSVPSAPRFVEGVINLRGEVIPVLHMRERFGLPREEAGRRSRIIIVASMERQYGLLVDEVRDIVEVEEDGDRPEGARRAGVERGVRARDRPGRREPGGAPGHPAAARLPARDPGRGLKRKAGRGGVSGDRREQAEAHLHRRGRGDAGEAQPLPAGAGEEARRSRRWSKRPSASPTR